MLRIERPQIVELKNLLVEALSLGELDDAVLVLGGRRDRIVLGNNLDDIFREIVIHFNNRSRIDDLLTIARIINLTDPGLFGFAQRYGLATAFPPAPPGRSAFEALIDHYPGTFDAGLWTGRAAEAESRVCLISDGATGRPLGTGFLVGPEAVLTNYHVARPFIEGGDPARLRFRFDFMLLPDGALGGAAAPLSAALPDWLIDHSPVHPSDAPLDHPGTPDDPPAPPGVPADALDYALLRVAGQPGKATVGGAAAPAGRGKPRGWLRLEGASFDFAAHRALLVLHHMQGRPLQLSINTNSFAADNAAANAAGPTRVYHRSNTDLGSSGAPVLSLDWDLVALHQGSSTIGGQTLNRAVPTAAIHALLASRGLLGVLA